MSFHIDQHRRPAGGHDAGATLSGSGALMASLMLGGLLAFGFRCVQRSHSQRHAARSPAVPKRVQTWENEGGRPDPQADEKADRLTAGL